MNAPATAPDLLHKNPNKNEKHDDPSSRIPDECLSLYRRARRAFCREILRSSNAWTAALRPDWSWQEDNPIQYENRIDRAVHRSWKRAKPNQACVARCARAVPTLMSVHTGLFLGDQDSKEDVIRANLRYWVIQGLRVFWNRRLSGEACALLRVRSSGVALRGVAPKPVIEACSSRSDIPG